MQTSEPIKIEAEVYYNSNYTCAVLYKQITLCNTVVRLMGPKVCISTIVVQSVLPDHLFITATVGVPKVTCHCYKLVSLHSRLVVLVYDCVVQVNVCACFYIGGGTLHSRV